MGCRLARKWYVIDVVVLQNVLKILSDAKIEITKIHMQNVLKILSHEKVLNILSQFSSYLAFTNITPPPGVNSACCNSSWVGTKKNEKELSGIFSDDQFYI